MKKINSNVLEIKNDFLIKNLKNSKKLNFLKKISKSPVMVSKKTGLVYHPDIVDSELAVNLWSKKIFKKKINTKNISYSSNFPGMQSRHFYIIDFLNRKFDLKKKLICDFATGEGSILEKLSSLHGLNKIIGTEHSLKNTKYIKNQFKKLKSKPPKIYTQKIEDLEIKEKVDLGILSWTLCNCSDPLNVVASLKRNIKKNGYILIAESSRILVPYRKLIQNYFNRESRLGLSHPWHWSFNSILNLFKVFGFTLVSNNRFWDEDNLILLLKNSHKSPDKQNFIFDDYKKVETFFKEWSKISKKFPTKWVD